MSLRDTLHNLLDRKFQDHDRVYIHGMRQSMMDELVTISNDRNLPLPVLVDDMLKKGIEASKPYETVKYEDSKQEGFFKALFRPKMI